MKKVYICSSCRQENFDYVESLLNKHELINTAFLFRPQAGQLKDKKTFADLDVKAIQDCDEVWVIGEYGRDCSWEIGFAAGLGKKVKVFKCEKNKSRLDDDWMMWAFVNKIQVIDLEKMELIVGSKVEVDDEDEEWPDEY